MLSRHTGTLAGLVLVASLALAGCGSDGSDATATDPAGSGSTSPAASGGGTTCSYPAGGGTSDRKVQPPLAVPTATGQVGATITTDSGQVGVVLDADAAPCTVNSFLSLAGQGFYDDTICPRITTAGSSVLMLQCGDPTGTTAGGPGYTFADELSGSEHYPAGTLAMANAGPDTNGSQFFLVYADSHLDPRYTVFGHIDKAGLKVLRAIAAKGTEDGSPDGAPADPVTITRVTVDD